MKVLLTGATGVIGRRALPLLVNAGHDVTALARAPDKRAALERKGAKAVDVSLFDVPALRRAVAGYDAVINLATHLPSSSVPMLLPGAWNENDRVRREGSANLSAAAAAGGALRFVQESFAPVYPDCGDSWIDESIPLQPVRYNLSVADAERSAERFAGGARSGVVLRFAAFYGPDSRFGTEMARVVLGVAAPRLPPAWSTFLFGSIGRMLARSLRISNQKLREASSWRPRYRSVREGLRALASPSQLEHPAGRPLST